MEEQHNDAELSTNIPFGSTVLITVERQDTIGSCFRKAAANLDAVL